ncbi:hypothetical protein PZT57_26875 [Pseudomonas aeruginosa]|uniref:hypothetical protein n=1 Tax=Pseudomonas aeruginosa TaxID=287 RepID=UPI002B26EB37|nr:hypothetical protein [Pseudomonas aeruginosa]MEA8592275.1 hypothetical protein [Pseudomonas aeruginosa]
MTFTRKALLMALSGVSLIGYLGYGEWNERSSEATEAANLQSYRQSLKEIEVPENLRQLPDLRGQGYVRDLLQAAVVDQELRELLQQYVSEPKMDRRAELVKPILVAWVKTSKRRPSIDLVLKQAKTNHPLYLQVSSPADERAEDLLEKIFVLEIVTGSQFFSFQGYTEDVKAGLGVVTLKSGAVQREIEVRLQDGSYTLLLRDLSLRPQQTMYIENAYSALVGSLDRSLLKGRYRYCLDNPLPGFETMNYEKLCRLELVLGSQAADKLATSAAPKQKG